MNTIVWLVQPIINKIDQFRNWTRRKEIAEELVRKERKHQADELCDELMREYLNALDARLLPYGEYERLADSFQKKLTRLYLKVR